MNVAPWLLAALLAGQNDTAASTAADRLEALHLQEAQSWRMYLDDSRRSAAKLRAEPIYVWTNPTRSRGQHGAVYLWLHQGRPVVIGSIFSHPELDQRMICHELHSLSTGTLLPERDPTSESWEPKGAVKMLPLPGAPPVAGTAGRRSIQMRSISKQFTAHSVDFQKERWELRLLPQPMYRYEKPEGDVVDGAIFAFVTSAGTDPEVVLVLEARSVRGSLSWHYRAIRFSDSDLFVQREGQQVWASIRDDKNQLHFNPDHTYRLIRDRAIPELPGLAAESAPSIDSPP